MTHMPARAAFRALAEEVALDGEITPDEIIALRRAGWSDGTIGAQEAEAILAVNGRIAEATPEWTDFLVEAVSEFVVNGVEPLGYVDDAIGAWLMDRIGHDGRLDTMAELELLVKVLEKATNTPQPLKDYALREIEQAVLTGTGPTRDGGELAPGSVTPSEVRILRRLIFAQAGDRPAAVSQHEAETLYRIKDATLTARNAPEWKRLFVQGVGNYLMASQSYVPLTTMRAAELKSFMDANMPGRLGFAARVARADVEEGLRTTFGRKKKPVIDRYAEMREAEKITPQEDAWLQGQIDANDQVDEYDTALLDFLREG